MGSILGGKAGNRRKKSSSPIIFGCRVKNRSNNFSITYKRLNNKDEYG